jgi:hypothetical protein
VQFENAIGTDDLLPPVYQTFCALVAQQRD